MFLYFQVIHLSYSVKTLRKKKPKPKTKTKLYLKKHIQLFWASLFGGDLMGFFILYKTVHIMK